MLAKTMFALVAGCGFTLPHLAAQAGAPVKRMSVAVQQAGLKTVKARLLESFVESADGASEVPVATLLATLDQHGRWPDLDLTYPPATSAGVSRYVHFLRVWKLAGAWRASPEVQRRSQLEKAARLALNSWLHQPKPASIPWFYLIGAPQAVARAALIMDDLLTAEQRRAAIGILRTCVRADGVLMYAGGPATGQNLQHEAELLIVAGLLEHDADTVARHVSLLEREIGIRDAEGLKADWSFHQHGPQLYSGGLYGNGFARDAAKLAWALQDTAFAFRPATVNALVHYVADGQQWMLRGRSFDYLTAGRMVAWPDFKAVEPEGEFGVADAATKLAGLTGLDQGRRHELLALAARKRGTALPETAPAGNRVFWASDYVSHQRPRFFASARMSSRRVLGTESGSGQNEQGYHLGDGAMGLMMTGEEYRDIFPLWDWRRVPGVTSVYNPDVPFPRHIWGKGAAGWSDFAGGVSDGVAGAAAMDLARGGLRARKAWFFQDDAVVALGATIQPDDPSLPVLTSIDQRWGQGAVLASAQSGSLAPETTHTQTGPGWVHHAGVSYLFPAGADLRIRYERKSAPWSVINSALHGSMFRTTSLDRVIAAGDVFSLWIDHGVNINGGASYAYTVAPGLAPADIATYQKNAAPAILSNTGQLQAVARDGLVQAVFWQSGQLKLPDGRVLSTNRPGMIQLRRDAATGKWILAVGNPTHAPGAVRVRLTAAAGGKPVERVFVFPSGLYAGQPQRTTLR